MQRRENLTWERIDDMYGKFGLGLGLVLDHVVQVRVGGLNEYL